MENSIQFDNIFKEDDNILLYFGSSIDLTPLLIGADNKNFTKLIGDSLPRRYYLNKNKKNIKVVERLKFINHYIYVDILLKNLSSIYKSSDHICKFLEIFIRWNFSSNIKIYHDSTIITFIIDDKTKFTFFYNTDWKDYSGPKDIDVLYISGFYSNEMYKTWNKMLKINTIVLNDQWQSGDSFKNAYGELVGLNNLIRGTGYVVGGPYCKCMRNN